MLALLALLDQFQTAIVGIIGFAGVILTLRHNAKLAKSERLERQAQERATVQVALATELRIARESLRNNLAKVNETIDANNQLPPAARVLLLVPAAPIASAFYAFLPRIGVLGSETLQPVMYAYLAITAAWDRLTLLSAPDLAGGYLQVPAPSHTLMKGMLENLLPEIDRAIVALGGNPDD